MRIIGNRRGGGSARAKVFTASVPLTTGLLTTVSTFGLLGPVTYAKTGGNANLTMASNGQISATAALGAGATQSLTGTATGADGVVFPFTANLTGAVSVPAAPTVTLTAGNGQVSIAYSANSNGGAAITGYNLYAGASAGSLALLGFIPVASASPYVDTGLTNGVARFYAMSAVNSVGEGALSATQSATPTALASPTATFTMAQFAAADAKRVFQRTTTTGGGQGKGQGTVPVTISGATAGTVNARCRAADGVTILQPEWQAATIGAGATTANVAGVDARLGWFFLDLKDSSGNWQNGTVLIGMGRVTAFAGQSLIVRFFSKQDQTPTFASSGITPEPNCAVLASYSAANPNYQPTVSTQPWEVPSDAGNITGLGINQYLARQVALFGVNCGAVGHSQGGTNIGTFLTGGANLTQFQALVSRAGGAFEAFFWGQGHGDSVNGMPALAYAEALSLLKPIVTAMSSRSFAFYLFTLPLYRNTQWGTPREAARVRKGAYDWSLSNSATYIAMDDITTLDGIHETQPGAVQMANHFYRATRAELALSNDRGPVPLSAVRSGTTITVTLSDVGQSSLVLTGTPGNCVHVFPRNYMMNGVSDTENRFPVSAVTSPNKTTLVLTLANDPGDGHDLDVHFYYPCRSNIDGSIDNIRDDRTDGDGISYGRQIMHSVGLGTGALQVAAPVPASTVNAPPGGFVQVVSRYNMTPTTPTYQASVFNQEINAGRGSVTRADWGFITVEAFFTCPPLSGVQVVFGTSQNWIAVNASGQVQSPDGTASGVTLVAGKRYHAAFVRDANGARTYLTNITDSINHGRIFNNAAPGTKIPTSNSTFNARNLTGSFVMTGGAVDEGAVFYGAKYTGTTYTTPTGPFTANDNNIIAGYHFDGNLNDFVDVVG